MTEPNQNIPYILGKTNTTSSPAGEYNNHRLFWNTTEPEVYLAHMQRQRDQYRESLEASEERRKDLELEIEELKERLDTQRTLYSGMFTLYESAKEEIARLTGDKGWKRNE